MSERHYFRVEYPLTARPLFVVDKESFPIINLSEGGMLLCCRHLRRKFAQQGDELEGTPVEGLIQFATKDTAKVKGIVVRQETGQFAIQFGEDGVSFQKIMHEQRQLIARFGTLKQPKGLG